MLCWVGEGGLPATGEMGVVSHFTVDSEGCEMKWVAFD